MHRASMNEEEISSERSEDQILGGVRKEPGGCCVHDVPWVGERTIRGEAVPEGAVDSMAVRMPV